MGGWEEYELHAAATSYRQCERRADAYMPISAEILSPSGGYLLRAPIGSRSTLPEGTYSTTILGHTDTTYYHLAAGLRFSGTVRTL